MTTPTDGDIAQLRQTFASCAPTAMSLLRSVCWIPKSPIPRETATLDVLAMDALLSALDPAVRFESCVFDFGGVAFGFFLADW